METTTTTTTTTEEMPVCADVCKQYKGSAANGGWTSMAFLCVQEKKNGNHKCYPPSRWTSRCSSKRSKCRVVLQDEEEEDQSSRSGRSLRGARH